MTKIDIAKRVAKAIVMFSSASAVKQVINTSVAPSSIPEKVAAMIAAHVIGAIVADAAGDWSDQKIDDLVAWWYKNVTEKF